MTKIQVHTSYIARGDRYLYARHSATVFEQNKYLSMHPKQYMKLVAYKYVYNIGCANTELYKYMLHIFIEYVISLQESA